MNSTQLTGPVDLFKAAWAFYKAHWKMLTSVVVLPYALIFIAQALAQVGVVTSSLAYVIGANIVQIAGMVLMTAAFAGLIKAVDALERAPSEAPMTVGRQFRVGFTYFWPAVLLGVMRFFIGIGSMALFIIPGIAVGIYILFAFLSLVVDDKRGMSALVDSYSLVRGRWWGVLGRLLFFILCYVIAVFVMVGADFILALVLGAHSPAYMVMTGILSMLLSLAFIPFAFVYSYKLYVAVKATRLEGGNPGAFKKWMVAFIVIGAFAVISVPFFLVAALSVVRAREARMMPPVAATSTEARLSATN